MMAGGHDDEIRHLSAKFRVSTSKRDEQILAVEDIGSFRVDLSIGTKDRSVKTVVMRRRWYRRDRLLFCKLSAWFS